MSKFAAIDVAVRLQMASDGADVVYDLAMRANASNPYNAGTMKTFLLNVANRLRLDQPAWEFAWNGLDVVACLDARLPMLISLIESQTKGPPKS